MNSSLVHRVFYESLKPLVLNMYFVVTIDQVSLWPFQVEGSQEMASMAGAVPAVEQREEYDPLATPDVDKLNAAYLAVHGSAILGRPMWQRTSSLSQQA